MKKLLIALIAATSLNAHASVFGAGESVNTIDYEASVKQAAYLFRPIVHVEMMETKICGGLEQTEEEVFSHLQSRVAYETSKTLYSFIAGIESSQGITSDATEQKFLQYVAESFENADAGKFIAESNIADADSKKVMCSKLRKYKAVKQVEFEEFADELNSKFEE